MKTKVSPKDETRRSTANWEKEIEHYLFDTNLRWSFLHTKIINRMPIRAGDAEEYVNTIEKTKALLSAQQEKTEKLVLERVRGMIGGPESPEKYIPRTLTESELNMATKAIEFHARNKFRADLLSKLSEMEEHEIL